MAAKRKLCKLCNEQYKKKDHPLWCLECWLSRQPVQVREKWARWRRSFIPDELHVSRIAAGSWPSGRRWCSGCQTFVRLEDCSPGASRCRTCSSMAAHAGMVRRTYGISAEEYRRLFVAQGGRCYICQRRMHSKRLAVDHDHETGEIRGLLCADNERGCNHAILGNIRDIAMARRIVAYLEDPPARRVLTSP